MLHSSNLGGSSKLACLDKGLYSQDRDGLEHGLSHTGPSVPPPGPGWKRPPEMLLSVWKEQRKITAFMFWLTAFDSGFMIKTGSWSPHHGHPIQLPDLFPDCLLWENYSTGLRQNLVRCTSPSFRRVPWLCPWKTFQFSFPLTAWEGHSPGGSPSESFCSFQFIIFRDVPALKSQTREEGVWNILL